MTLETETDSPAAENNGWDGSDATSTCVYDTTSESITRNGGLGRG